MKAIAVATVYLGLILPLIWISSKIWQDKHMGNNKGL